MTEDSVDKRSGMWASEWNSNIGSTTGKEPLKTSATPPGLSEDFLKRTGSWSVLWASGRYRIPNIHLSDLGVMDQGGSREVFALGSGLTSKVVRHVTDESTESILPRNSTIAVKVYRDKPNRTPDDRRALFDIILREIEAFGHPLLAKHENLVKLLFIGWRQGASVPALAMELGEFGSLDYVLQNPEYGLTFQQKRHVTIDIAVGLYAIYQAGFIHGDIKPDNIILTSIAEPDRDVIAKLTDFGGSGQMDNEALGTPLHFTPRWAAPETHTQRKDIDWSRADVYSWGLIVASIWAQSEDGYGTDGGSQDFLTAQIPDGLEQDEYKYLLEYWKSDNNILEPLQDRLRDLDISDETLDDLLKVLRLSLETSPTKRPDTRELVKELRTLIAAAHRETPKERDDSADLDDEGHAETPNFFSWDRSSTYAGILHEQMLLAFNEIDDLGDDDIQITDLPPDLDDTISSRNYMGLMRSSIDAVVKEGLSKTTRWVDMEGKGLAASYLFYWKLVRPTSPEDVEEGIEMLRRAAMNGNTRAICLYAPALAKMNNDHQFPSVLYLSLLVLAHSDWAMEVLSTQHPSHYNRVRSIIRERSSVWEETKWKFGKRHDPFMLSTFLAYATQAPSDSSPTSLNEAIEIGTVEDIQNFLHDPQPDTAGSNLATELLHRLARRPDTEAAELAEESFKYGAKLTYLASIGAAVDPSTDTFRWLPSALSPLSAALKKGKRRLAGTILRLHLDNEQPIVDFHSAIAISCAQLDGESTLALLQLQKDRPHLCLDGSELWRPTVERLSRLLWFAMDIDLTLNLNLERRAMLGISHSDARQEILKLLLHEGADPIDGEGSQTPLSAALRVDDVVAVDLFLKHLHKSDRNVLDWIADMSGKGLALSAAFFCVHFNTVQCFEYLLNHYLGYLLADRSETGSTLLHVACDQDNVRDAETNIRAGNIKFVQLMLANGFDVLATTDSGQTPLFLALRSNNLAAADEMFAHVSDKQKMHLLTVSDNMPIFVPLLMEWKKTRSWQALASIKWVFDHGGAQDIPSEYSPLYGFYTACIKGIRPSTRAAQIMDRRLLECLLDSPEVLQTIDIHGPKLLLTAVCGGHIEVVEEIVHRDTNLNELVDPRMLLPATFPEAMTRIQLTVRDMARMMQCGHIPPAITQGGYLEVREWRRNIDAIEHVLAKKRAQSPAFNALLRNDSLENIQTSFARNFMNKDLNERLVDKLKTLGMKEKQTISSSFWPAPIPQRSLQQAESSGFRKQQQQEWQDEQRALQSIFNPQNKEKVKERCDHRHAAWCNACDKTIFGTWYKCLDCEDFDYCEDCVEDQAFLHPNHRMRLVRCKCQARAARKANTVLDGWLAKNYKGAAPAVWPVPPS